MRNSFKKFIAICLILPSLALSSGIPTVDVAAASQNALSYASQLAEYAKVASRWKEEISHYKKQLQSYADQLNATTGVKDSIKTLRDLKQIYNDFGRAYVNMQDFKNSVLNDPMKFIENELKDAYAKYTLYDRCGNIEDKESKSMCLVDFTITAFEEKSLDESIGQLDQINKSIADLDQKLRNSTDIKESQDIHNAISSEALKLQMIQAKLDIEAKQYEKQRIINEERKKQLLAKTMRTNFDVAKLYK